MVQHSTGATAPAAPPPAFALGWLMAEMFDPLQTARILEPTSHLPVVSQLDGSDSMRLHYAELKRLLAECVWALDTPRANRTRSASEEASALSYFGATGLHTYFSKTPLPPHADLQTQLRQLNQSILQSMVVAKAPWAAAYQLGTTLRDTCSPPRDQGEFIHRFHRHRMATLAGWLGEAESGITPGAANIVSQSLRHWSAWVDTNGRALRSKWTNTTNIPRPPAVHSAVTSLARSQRSDLTVKDIVNDALDAQGRLWKGLLGAETSPSSEPGITAWIQAGESMVRTARQLTGRILRHFWIPIVVVLAATGALLYLIFANTNSDDLTRIWASLVAVAGGFGITGSTVRTASRRLATNLEQPAWSAAEVEARAWAATVLPALPMGAVRLHRLRKRGVGAPVVTTEFSIDPVPPATRPK
jgi:hypothetical protein